MQVAVGVFGVLGMWCQWFALLGWQIVQWLYRTWGGRTVTFFSNDSRKTSSSMHVLTTSGSSDTLINIVRAFLAMGV